MTESTKYALYDALAAFQDEMPSVPRTRVGRGYEGREYRYADLADMTEAARPLLSKHELVYYTTPGVDPEGRPVVTGHLVHTHSGESITGTLPLHGRHPQELGSALTYARRYLLGCLTGLITDEDDDGASAAPTHAGRPAQVEAAIAATPDILRARFAEATSVEDMRAIYTEAHLDAAPEDIRAMYHARVLELRKDTSA